MQRAAKTNKDTDPVGTNISHESSMTNVIGKTCKESSNVDPFLSTEDAKKYDAWTNGHVLEMTLFLNADRNRHGQLMIELANDYVKGISNHPPSFAECFAFLLKHTPSRMNKLIKIKMMKNMKSVQPYLKGKPNPRQGLIATSILTCNATTASYGVTTRVIVPTRRRKMEQKD